MTDVTRGDVCVTYVELHVPSNTHVYDGVDALICAIAKESCMSHMLTLGRYIYDIHASLFQQCCASTKRFRTDELCMRVSVQNMLF